MKGLTGFSLLLVIVLVSLSAYLRLAHSGIGCGDWPDCYGHIGQVEAATTATANGNGSPAYRELVDAANQPLAWATPLHRLVASVLGLAIIFLTVLAFRARRKRGITLLLLGLTVFLALLGLRSGGLHQPAIIMGNLAGGFAMLALLGGLWFSLAQRRHNTSLNTVPPALLWLALALLLVQVLLGGLTSANFAAHACHTLPDCQGSWWPGREIITALDLSRSHTVDASGRALGGMEREAIHQAHRIGAVLTAGLLLLTALLAFRAAGRWRPWGLLLAGVLLLEFGVGVAAVLMQLPIGLAVAHNWLAGLLLLVMLKLLQLSRQTRIQAVYYNGF